MRTLSSVFFSVFIYMWYLTIALSRLFRLFQLTGVRRKLILVCGSFYCLDALYRVVLQALGISHSKIPLNILIFVSVCWQVYLLKDHFEMLARSRTQKLTFFFQMTVPICFSFLLAIAIASFIYPTFSKQNREDKLLIALLAPLI